MKLTKLAALGFVAAAVIAPMPAFAAVCVNEGPQAPTMTIDEGGQAKAVVDTEAQASLDRRRLKEVGVIATSVERWGGCLRAYVKHPDGTNAMEIYDPVTLRIVQ